MKNKILFLIKKKWFLFWMLISALVIYSIAVFAAYDTSNSVMKRVIVSSDGKSTGFTSNLLTVEISTGQYVHRTLYRSVSESRRYNAEVIIRNHEPDYPDFPYEDDIYYDLTVCITDSSGNAITDLTDFGGETGKKIILKDQNGNVLTTLPLENNVVSTIIQNQKIEYEKGRPGELKYDLVFENWDIETDTGYEVKLIANLVRGQNNAYPELSDIGCSVGLKKNKDYEENGWDAFLNESHNTITNTVYAYNLVLTGSGEADIKIQWDPENISLNSLFRNTEAAFDLKNNEVEYITHSGTEEWDTLIVHANSNDPSRDLRSYYDIQVYSTGAKRITENDFKKLTESDNTRGDSLITVSITNK